MIGNYGDGWINAYNLFTGEYRRVLTAWVTLFDTKANGTRQSAEFSASLPKALKSAGVGLLVMKLKTLRDALFPVK